MTKQQVPYYIKAIRKSLEQKYGGIKYEWEIYLDMLSDNLKLYIAIRDRMEREGSEAPDNKHTNPNIKAFKEISANIMKLTVKLGVSPYDEARIKCEEKGDNDDYLDSLDKE